MRHVVLWLLVPLTVLVVACTGEKTNLEQELYVAQEDIKMLREALCLATTQTIALTIETSTPRSQAEEQYFAEKVLFRAMTDWQVRESIHNDNTFYAMRDIHRKLVSITYEGNETVISVPRLNLVNDTISVRFQTVYGCRLQTWSHTGPPLPLQNKFMSS